MDQQQLNDLRMRAISGPPLTKEELREVLAYLRNGRVSALEGGKKSTSGGKKAKSESIVDAKAFLDSLL